MNKHLNGGDEMKGLKMKIGNLIGVLIFCMSSQVAAEVGQKPFPKIEGGSRDDVRPPSPLQDVRRPAPDQSGGQACAAEASEVSATSQLIPGHSIRDIPNEVAAERKRWGSQLCADVSRNFSATEKYHSAEAAKTDGWVGRNDEEGRRIFRLRIAQHRLQLCFLRARSAECNRSPPAMVPGSAGSPQPSANTAPAGPSYSSANSQEAQRLNTQLSEAEARAQNNQAKVDRARKGKPKRHVEGSVAHQCLTPQPGGGVVNSCPYAVEYSYCVLRPTKGSWSEAFDCEKSKGGSWQVGPGPNSRSIMHTAGLTTYFFACKYGETLHKPDGISPADIEFQIGRGLLGRCAEWGAGK